MKIVFNLPFNYTFLSCYKLHRIATIVGANIMLILFTFYYQEIIEKSSEIKRLTVENCAGNNEAVAQAQCLQRAIEQEIVQKTNLIIALQGKLLAQTEEIDDMRKENGEFKLLNTKLKEEVSALFDIKRRFVTYSRQGR